MNNGNNVLNDEHLTVIVSVDPVDQSLINADNNWLYFALFSSVKDLSEQMR